MLRGRILNALVFGVLLSIPAPAQVMSTFVREQVGTLPKGRFMVSYLTLNASIDSMYSREGQAKPLSGNLNQAITFQKITSEDPVRGNQLSGLFLANGVQLADSAGQLSGVIQGSVSGKVPVLGYGITDELGLYISMPVLNFQINSAYVFTPSGSTNGFLAGLNASDQTSVAAEMSAALNTSLENKLYNAGIAWDPNLNRSYLGDIQVMLLKVLPSKDKRGLQQSIQPTVTLPTASDQDLHDLYGLKAGDRRLGLGVKYSLEQKLGYRFQLNLSGTGTYLFSNQQGRRIPKSSTDELNELLDPNARVSGGAKFQGQIQARYTLPKWVGLSTGLVWQNRFEESITGSAFAPDLYALASERSAYHLLSSYASIDLNSIQSFIEGNFIFPAVAELGVGLPLTGRNAISEPVFQLQGTMFF